jgi:hypothetical protein
MTTPAPADRGTVERAREVLAASLAADFGRADRTDLLVDIGRLQAAVQLLLNVIDGPEQ